MVEGPSQGPSHRGDEAVPRTVVVPLDGSARSEASLPLGYLLAERFRATVQTVTVGPTSATADLVLEGDPAAALLDHLAGLDRTLVCMSSHGYGGVRRRLVGSVAEVMIRRSPVPVIVSGPRVGPPDRVVARSILAGLAWSPNLDRLADTLTAWAPLLDARVELSHVRRPSATELYATRVTGRASADRPPINTLAAAMTEQGLRATVHPMTSTDPAAALLSLAEELPPPVLIAVDTHRDDESVHHDIAYQLIRHSPWPVLATVGA